MEVLKVFFDPVVWIVAVVVSSIVTFIVWHAERKDAEQSVEQTGEESPED